jgi:phosphoadenosine phosphosulfate reductase
MLLEETLFGTVDKVQIAIDRIKQFEPPEGYYVAFSGGKDSQTVYHLCKEAGVKFDAHYNLTTVDPPELVRFIKTNYPDVIIERPRFTMWELIVKNGSPPTRLQRYCCRELKEHGGENRMTVTGVRWAESVRRSKTRAMLETFPKKSTEKIFSFLRLIFIFLLCSENSIPCITHTRNNVLVFIKSLINSSAINLNIRMCSSCC